MLDGSSMIRSFAVTALLAAAVLAGCGSDDEGPQEPAAAPEPPATSTDVRSAAAAEEQAEPAARRRRGTKIALGGSQFGRVLFDGREQAVYIFDRERSSRPRCYGDCAVAWPPVLTRGEPVAGRGVRPSLLGTVRRRDGKRQVTYNGHPLYYYEEPPGIVTCHNVREFGGLWLAVRANGNRVR
jgi:predicted lipoprotein with Yx(FWY)xxD motif